MKKRIISLFCALLLLTPGFLLRTRSGRDSILRLRRRSLARDRRLHGRSLRSRPGAARRGLPLEDAAALTRALEDFCT